MYDAPIVSITPSARPPRMAPISVGELDMFFVFDLVIVVHNDVVAVQPVSIGVVYRLGEDGQTIIGPAAIRAFLVGGTVAVTEGFRSRVAVFHEVGDRVRAIERVLG